jgi:hypothetical protein
VNKRVKDYNDWSSGRDAFLGLSKIVWGLVSFLSHLSDRAAPSLGELPTLSPRKYGGLGIFSLLSLGARRVTWESNSAKQCYRNLKWRLPHREQNTPGK